MLSQHMARSTLQNELSAMHEAKWIVDIVEEPRGEVLAQLLRFCGRCSEQMTLVVRDMDLAESGEAFLTSVSSFLTQSTRSREWPGTILQSGDATVLTYAVGPDLIETLLRSVTGLYAFSQPRFPEDPCFYAGTSDFLVTISHERDAYLVLDECELEVLLLEVPGLKAKPGSRAGQ